MTTDLTFTLKEISLWTSDASVVKIPELQRGLVWKPAQVELLWDSILRGFPVGSFMLSDVPEDKDWYYLMDGQQRFNAISIGFGAVENPRAILWLDINPEEVKNSSRTFWIKATTIAHPWGFANNDECSTLSSSDRRLALKEFGFAGKNIYNDVVDLHDTWPIKASRPIPLQFFLDAPVDSEDAFVKYIISKCGQQECMFRGLFVNPVTEADKERIASFYDAFSRLKDYSISCNLLTRNVLENETSVANNEGGVTTLETLFTRLNTGGTRITQEDLIYSAIKAYWPEIKDKNGSIAERYMPPAKLVMLAFRLALTEHSQDKAFKGAMSAKQIRSLATDDMSKQRIDDLYCSDKLARIMNIIDDWLNVFNAEKNPAADSTPAVLRTSIARNSTEIYLLLMYFALKSLEGKSGLSGKEIRALAFYLHWFSKDVVKAVAEVYNQCRNRVDMDAVRRAISLSFVNGWLVAPYTPEEMRHFFSVKPDPDWQIGSEEYYPWQDFANKVFWFGSESSKEMLLFAQRTFINTHFRMYDPARQDMWDSHNRPWDYDHITPQEWIVNKRGPFREYCKGWLWNIGNIAAIPFEENRSKSNREDYDFYVENKETLLFDESSMDLKNDIVWNKEEGFKFASVTFGRCCEIYKSCYDLFAPLFEKIVLSDDLQKRKETFLKIADSIEGSKFYFTAGAKDYLLERALDWTREWISVGVPYGKYLVCVCWGYNQSELELGLRKLPGTMIDSNRSDMPKLDDSYEVYEDNQWWYAWKPLHIMPAEVIVTELRALIGFLPE